jgi:hypothetical protein
LDVPRAFRQLLEEMQVEHVIFVQVQGVGIADSLQAPADAQRFTQAVEISSQCAAGVVRWGGAPQCIDKVFLTDLAPGV